jgi:hypothetical protein
LLVLNSKFQDTELKKYQIPAKPMDMGHMTLGTLCKTTKNDQEEKIIEFTLKKVELPTLL